MAFTRSLVVEPRLALRVFVPTLGTSQDRIAQTGTDDVFTLDVRPIKIGLDFNNYNEADVLNVEGSYDEMGLDPRYLRSAEVRLYAQDVNLTGGAWTPGLSNQRFVGIARDVHRKFTESAGKVVSIVAHDYTCLFLECKSFSPQGIPLYTDTLRQAWNRVCDWTGWWDFSTSPPSVVSTVQNLKSDGTSDGHGGGPLDPLQFINLDPDTVIGKAVPARLAKLGKLQVPHGADAWAVWRTACESVGLVTFIRGAQCFVTSATDFYTATDPPRMVYGSNILELDEGRELGQLSAKNVCVRSFDPLTASSLESLYPPPQATPKKKRLAAAGAKGTPSVVHSQDYETMDLPFPVNDQAVLDNIARRVWEERTRQEMRGTLTTREMVVGTVSGAAFDLLALQAGDQVQIEISRDALDDAQKQSTIEGRIGVLVGKGYSTDMATFIAKNLDAIDKLPPQFLVHSVHHEIAPATPDGPGSYETKIEFVNRIDISQDDGALTNQATGTTQAPFPGQTVST